MAETAMISAVGASGGGGLTNRLIALGAGSPFALRGAEGVRGGFGGSTEGVGGAERSGGFGASGEVAGAGGGRTSAGAVRSTAYQRTEDGDEATFSSRSDELTEDERREVEQLKARDQEVKTHEQAHVAAAGSLFRGGPYYDYQTGPDGKRYAVGGRVSIDTSPGRTPEETIAKAAQIRAAAMAPAEPSSTDRAVAAQASAMAQQARQEQIEEQQRGDRERADGMVAQVRGEGSIEPVNEFDIAANAPARDSGVFVPNDLREPVRGLSAAESAGLESPGRGGGSLLGKLYA